MNLRQIEVFKAVMSTGSVSDASRLLHVSVPAASRVLSHAESQLGFLLFERIKGRLHPTPEARQLYAEVEEVYKGVKRIERMTHELAERRHGLLSVVSSPSIGQMIVPLALNYFHTSQPGVRVHFDCLNYEALKERILNKHVDLGMSTLPMEHPHLRTIPIAASRLMLICKAGHPLAKLESIVQKDLVDRDIISYPPHSPFGMRVDKWFAQAGMNPRVVMQVGSPQNACALVHVGNGIAIVDEFALLDLNYHDLVSIPVLDVQPIVAHLVYLRTTPLSPTSQAFIHCLRSILLERGLAIQNAP